MYIQKERARERDRDRDREGEKKKRKGEIFLWRRKRKSCSLILSIIILNHYTNTYYSNVLHVQPRAREERQERRLGVEWVRVARGDDIVEG